MSLVQTDYDLANFNTLAVPSRAGHFLKIESQADLQTAVTYSRQNSLKVLVLGQGSNLVLGAELDVLVLKIELPGKRIESFNDNTALVELAAGENWHESVSWCLDQGLFGIENLALIPGTVGAAPVQNIGAYGVELSESLEKLEYFDLVTGELHQITNNQCQFEYRDSRFKKDLLDRAVITRIWLRLGKGDDEQEGNIQYPVLKSYLDEKGLSATPKNIFNAVCAIRQSRLPDPRRVPNVGSFFHNPVVPQTQYAELQQKFSGIPGYPQSGGSVKVPAAWLIEALGWKGKEQFGVKVSDHHALVLTNPNHCLADEILKMADAIQASVWKEFEIRLNIEPRVYPQC